MNRWRVPFYVGSDPRADRLGNGPYNEPTCFLLRVFEITNWTLGRSLVTVLEMHTMDFKILTEIGTATYNESQIILFKNYAWMNPMSDRPNKVKVKFHSGYKGEETPRSVVFRDKELPIEQIIARKRILDPKTADVREEYTIKLKGQRAILKIYSSGECELVDLSE